MLVQVIPVAATPFEQVQLLAWQAFPFFVRPALQDAHIALLSEIQAALVAASPFEQVQ
jgi:hypothetical protein